MSTEEATKTQAAKPAKSNIEKMAAILSAVLWTFSFFLSFVITPGSKYIWLPDGLLLIGFIPLLLIWRPAWPWLVFGILNMLIGMVLEIAKYLPDDVLPAEMRAVRGHLSQFHVGLVWILIGFGACTFGVVRLTSGLVRRFRKR